MRVIASVLCVIALVSGNACSGKLERNSTTRSSQAIIPQWQPSKSVPGGFYRELSGDPDNPGPFRYQIKIPAGGRIAAHRHSVAMRVKVLSGAKFILIGEPLSATRTQNFVEGSEFFIPAGTWHTEWWVDETIEEIDGVGPMETTFKP